MLNIVHNNVYFVHIAAHHYFLQKQDMMRISFYLKLRKQYICHHIKLCKLVPHLTKVMKQKMYTANIQQCLQFLQYVLSANPGGGTLGISGWGCAAGTLEPLTYTRASSAEFCYPVLE